MSEHEQQTSRPGPGRGCFRALFSGMGLSALSVTLVFLLLEGVLRMSQPHGDRPFDGTVYAVHAPPELISAFTWDGQGNSLAHVRSSNPVLVYEMRPGVRLNDFISINSHGFRDGEYAQEKPADVFRICAIGDSVTFGWWQRLEETYPKVLEGLLAARAGKGPRYEVLNMGVGGYNAEQEAELFASRVLRFQPDLLLVQYCENDHMIGQDAGLWRHFTRSGSRAWDWISLRALQIRKMAAGGILRPAYERIARVAGEHGIPVAAVIFHPCEPRRSGAVTRVAEMCAGLGFTVVDLWLLNERPDLKETFADFIHPTVLGHRIAAEEILRRLDESGLLGGPPAGDSGGAPAGSVL
ncbi:MAG TPA: SGNH/GDSL hydrolase family protein [Candidatus Hydrogenedentes bacterium]|nr:SGNH/GDSL hydrolase family protein [Candidatus Hydrogenedentota bacterium]